MANVKDLLVNGSARVIGTIYGNATSANKVNHSLTFGSKSFNGSSAQTITLADLGGKPTQSAVSSPSTSGTEISFIDTISQNANGVITATKKTVRDASASQSGVVNTGTQTFAGAKTFTSNTRIQLATPNLYLRDTNTNADTYSIIRFGNSSNENAAYIFLNGPSRTNDGGTNMFTIRNNVGDLRLNNDVINTGKLTIGQATKNTSYTLTVNGTSYQTDVARFVKTGTAAIFGGTLSNIDSAIYAPTSGIQLCAGNGGATNSTAIGFHNPGISSAVFGYYQMDANNGQFRMRSEDKYWDLSLGGTTKLTSPWGKANLVVGENGYDKIVAGYLVGTLNGAVIGAHNSALTAWAPLNVSGSTINFRENETLRGKILDGCLSLFPSHDNYRDGIRIHANGSWSDILLCGADNTGDSGTSANSWFIGNNNGNFYLTRNGSTSSTASYLSVISNYWQFFPKVGINGTNTNYNLYTNGTTLLHMGNASGASTELSPTLRVNGKINIYDNVTGGGTANSLLNILYNGSHEYGIVMKLHSYGGDSPAIRFSHSSDINDLNKQVNTNWSVGMYYNTTDKFAITQDRGTDGWGAARLIMDPGGVTNFYVTNKWLNDSVIQIGRKTDTALTDRAVIGVTDGNLHLDPYGGHDTYLNFYNPAKTYFSGSTYYISNDGSYYNGSVASAANADTVDGYHGQDLEKRIEQWVDLSSLNQNMWYPVTGGFGVDGYNKIEVDVRLNSGTKPNWSTHNSGFTCHLVVWAIPSGWGTTSMQTLILDHQYIWCSGDPCGYTQLSNGSVPILWLRGGGKYKVITNYRCTWTVQTGTYSNNGQTAAPQSSNPGVQYQNSSIMAGAVYGAVWNDYAEYRQSDTTEPGRVVIENGDGTLSLSIKRLQRGAEVISDTFGFAIGETDECKTPIAATGRVLAYTYEPVEEYKSKTGWPVCSGPNGTVSIMTEEEEEKYPSRIIGTISEVPDYEEWGTGKVKTNGRVWIRIK